MAKGARSRGDGWERLNRRIVGCDRCPRLREHCTNIAREKRRSFREWTYWGRPVPNFGDPRARVLVVGLAPAAHGANRTGRMFTGDRSGEWLYRALHKAGFASRPDSEHREDGLQLYDCAITAVCHCAPPANRPTRQEIQHCREWLDATVGLLPVRVFLALGGVAWNAVCDLARRQGWLEGARPRFAHGEIIPFGKQLHLVGSYHPSQQNTFTGRLTEPMFDAVFQTVRQLLDAAGTSETA